jgi:pimeloyl-ACP methyl ester carboxylesterase
MSLSFKEFGVRGHPTIVFLHGGGIANWMWDKQVEQLKSDYHCLVPDLPEHGESMDIAPFSIRSASELVRELIVNQAHDQHAHVVGLSLGAQVALDMMHICPEVMDKTIVSGTLVRPMKAYRKYIGPMVVGTRWYANMSTPTTSGLMTPTGDIQGGHCYVINGIDEDAGVFRIKNSWGRGWGVKGHAFITFGDFEKLLLDGGEACITFENKMMHVPELLFS